MFTKYCGDVSHDVILIATDATVSQRILGLVGNVIYCFVANLTDFLAANKF